MYRRRGVFLVVSVTIVAAGCSSGSSKPQGAGTPSTAATATTTSTTPRPLPRDLPGTALNGEVAFLGPIRTVPVGHNTIAFRQFGSGPDIVLISGQASPMSQWPVSTLAWLAKRHRVTIYDNRDLGNTTTSTERFALTELADDAAGLIGALGLTRPAVFGWSTGGEIGLLLAVRHPEALSSLAITGATPGGPKSVLPPTKIINLFASANPDLAALFDVLFSPSGAAAQQQFVNEFLKVPQPTVSAATTAKYDEAEKDYWSSPEPDLGSITVPVLVMNGAGDYAVPPANAKYITTRIGPRARLALDAGGRHAWFVEHPQHFQALIAQFLR